MQRPAKLTMLAASILLLVTCLGLAPGPQTPSAKPMLEGDVKRFGAVGDGKADDTQAIQDAVNSSVGAIRFPKGVFRLTKTITIDLDRVGPTSLSSDGTARIVMAGPGPAFRFVGTHEGTASPTTFQENVWLRQRSPMVDALEIVGRHPKAVGIEAKGTMQLTLTRVVVREALHGIHLVERNRNVTLSECHVYNNHGIGVFMERLNLHQVNIANCHISYNDGGGIVLRQSVVRNLQIGTCDIEGNMGGPDSEPTANVLLDSRGASIGEVAIVGCTIQHSHNAPNSANIRIDGRSTVRPFTDELRHGNITIADNVLSDVQVNIDLQDCRAVTISGNTIWKGYQHNLRIAGCENVIVANNVFDRNPRYHYSDGADAQLAVLLENCSDCNVTGNLIKGCGNVPVAMTIRQSRRMNITACAILDCPATGLLLDNVSYSRVSDCLIGNENAGQQNEISLHVSGGQANMIVDNYFGNEAIIEADGCKLIGNLVRNGETGNQEER